MTYQADHKKELVHVEEFAKGHLLKAEVDISKVFSHHFPSNDAWCSDHGPAFLVNGKGTLMITANR
ncbi:agmatine deiminase family protein [Cecembia calidifontis]|uniref:agmatine deiminase family protein n=1 Tax=Cecembia calidifontis TaxID=1187080 RepID=UPI0013EE76ED|nr:agmatine deiminase family protein [Cecembia calidifontis]